MNTTLMTGLLAATLALPGIVRANPEQDALEAARREVEQARKELREATRELERLVPDALPRIDRELVFRDQRPMVGVVFGASRDLSGVRLAGITPGGAADKAGLKSGDVVVAINGQPLAGGNAVPQAYRLLEDMQVGDRFEFTVRGDDGAERTVVLEAEMLTPQVVIAGTFDFPYAFDFSDTDFNLDNLRVDLERLRDGMAGPVIAGLGNIDDLNVWTLGWQWSGLELARMNPGLGRYFGTEQGALVLETQLDDADLLAGDVIVAVNSEPVTSPKDAMRQLRSAPAGEPVKMAVVRDGRTVDIEVTAPERRGEDFFYRFETSRDDEDG